MAEGLIVLGLMIGVLVLMAVCYNADDDPVIRSEEDDE